MKRYKLVPANKGFWGRFAARMMFQRDNLRIENKRLRDALEQIANSDGWTLEPYPLCTAEQAHERCIEAATKALGVDNDGY